MLDIVDRVPAPGKANRVRIRQDNGQIVEGVLEYADDATIQGTPWAHQTGRLLQADIRNYPIAAGQTIQAGDVVDVVSDISTGKEEVVKTAVELQLPTEPVFDPLDVSGLNYSSTVPTYVTLGNGITVCLFCANSAVLRYFTFKKGQDIAFLNLGETTASMRFHGAIPSKASPDRFLLIYSDDSGGGDGASLRAAVLNCSDDGVVSYSRTNIAISSKYNLDYSGGSCLYDGEKDVYTIFYKYDSGTFDNKCAYAVLDVDASGKLSRKKYDADLFSTDYRILFRGSTIHVADVDGLPFVLLFGIFPGSNYPGCQMTTAVVQPDGTPLLYDNGSIQYKPPDFVLPGSYDDSNIRGVAIRLIGNNRCLFVAQKGPSSGDVPLYVAVIEYVVSSNPTKPTLITTATLDVSAEFDNNQNPRTSQYFDVAAIDETHFMVLSSVSSTARAPRVSATVFALDGAAVSKDGSVGVAAYSQYGPRIEVLPDSIAMLYWQDNANTRYQLLMSRAYFGASGLYNTAVLNTSTEAICIGISGANAEVVFDGAVYAPQVQTESDIVSSGVCATPVGGSFLQVRGKRKFATVYGSFTGLGKGVNTEVNLGARPDLVVLSTSGTTWLLLPDFTIKQTGSQATLAAYIRDYGFDSPASIFGTVYVYTAYFFGRG